MIDYEEGLRIARRLEDAAERADKAAARLEEATRKLEILVCDEYGGNIPKLLKLIEEEEG